MTAHLACRGLALLALLASCRSGGSAPGDCADPLTIDDLEDGDRSICVSADRRGSWSVVGDGTSRNLSPKGDFTPALIPGGRGDSRYAARMTGFGFTGTVAFRPGAFLRVTLNDGGAGAPLYDASAIQGVKFWMRSTTPVSVRFPTAETIAAGQPGGACADSATEFNCDNPFLFAISAPAPNDWVEYAVPFAAATQFGYAIDVAGHFVGGNAAWDPAHLVEVQFAVSPGQTFDVWIDDLRFFTCAGADCVPTCTDLRAPVACPEADGIAAGCYPAGTDCARIIPVQLTGLWGSGRDDVWAVGRLLDRNSLPSGGAIFHWDGMHWSPSPSGTDTAAVLYWAVWGSAPEDVWAVGFGGAIRHWNGTGWSPVASGTGAVLVSIWGSGPDDVWAVGTEGTILHWDGTTWSTARIDATDVLVGIWGSGPDDVWAVGYLGNPDAGRGGVIVHWDGTVWSPVPVDAYPLQNVWGSEPNDIWAVGSRGTIMHWDGTIWSDIPSGTNASFLSVWGSGAGDVWAVGPDASIFHRNGVAWAPFVTGSVPGLINVWGSGAQDVWAVGDLGVIQRWNGAAWAAVSNEGLGQ